MRVRVSLLALFGLIAFPAAASANYPHVIQRGETLTSVARVDGLTVSALAAANGMSVNSELVAGQILEIPPRGVTPKTVTATAQQTTTVRPVSTHSATSYGTLSAPIATAERVPGSEIAYIANANGVPASFAEAIAWQESGWNNAEVSDVGAVGVMQIVPSTWRWIDRYLTPANPLGTASAAENVRGGVLLLHQLLATTGDSYALTAAGYFQGLASVKRYGMYRSTRQYVTDVLALRQRLAG
jgi:N-acetylmuramoyl-L-alanine amidase